MLLVPLVLNLDQLTRTFAHFAKAAQSQKRRVLFWLAPPPPFSHTHTSLNTHMPHKTRSTNTQMNQECDIQDIELRWSLCNFLFPSMCYSLQWPCAHWKPSVRRWKWKCHVLLESLEVPALKLHWAVTYGNRKSRRTVAQPKCVAIQKKQLFFPKFFAGLM